MIRRRFVLAFVSLLTAACPREAPDETAAEPLALHFEVVENFDAGGFSAALTLANRRATELPDEGWELYFNFGRAFVAESLPPGIAISHLNGDLYRLEPTAAFEPLAPGDSRRLALEGRGTVVRETDAPAGFYVVFLDPDGRPRAPEPVTVTLAPFETPRQTRRSAADRMEVPSPESRYERNRRLARLAADDVGRIVPTPVALRAGGGSLTVDGSWTIRHGAGLAREAAYLADALAPLLGSRLAVAEGSSAASDAILVEIGKLSVAGVEKQPGDEAYRLEVDPAAGIRIAGSDPAGVFYGLSSLRALVPVSAYARAAGPIELPELEVEDAPRFAYRGMHLDVARNFQRKESVLKLLDLMAFYKLNRFHFHLSDDEGWRLAIAGLSELTEVGGRRGHTTDESDRLVPSFGSGPDPEPAVSHGSGWYTREEFVEILRYARDRHIQVIPEFDVPGHARAAIRSMAARRARLAARGDAGAAGEFLLSDPGDTSQYRSVQGWTDNVVDVCLESTYRFLETVVADVVAIYAEAGAPLETFHVGGDEVPGGAWTGSPACRQRLEEDPELSDVHDLPGYFLRRLSAILDRHGLATAGWEEIALIEKTADGGTVKVPNEAFADRGFRPYVWNSVWGWGSEDVGYRLANAGYRVVLSNASNLYFDLAYEKHPQEPGYDWAGFTDTRKPWELEPLDLFSSAREDRLGNPIDPARAYADSVRLTPAGRRNVLGIQGQLWGENALGQERMEYLTFPKLLGLAERAWAAIPDWATTDGAERERLQAAAWNEFANRLGQIELPRLDHLHGGVGYRLPPPGAVVEDGRLHANVAFPGLAIRYTTDGAEPTAESELYAGPVAVSGAARLKTFDTRGRGSRTAVVAAR